MGLTEIDIGPAYGTVSWSRKDVRSFVNGLLETACYVRQVNLGGGSLDVGPLYEHTQHVGGALRDSWGCQAASSNLAFMPNGWIVGCSALGMLASRYPEVIIGDLAHGVDGAAVDHFLQFAQGGPEDRPRCHKCKVADNCTGGCLAINLSHGHAPFSAPAFYCRTMAAIPAAWESAWGIGEGAEHPATRVTNRTLQQAPATLRRETRRG